MRKTVKLQSYQFRVLERVFKTRDIPMELIATRMQAVLPQKYAAFMEEPVPIDKQLLLLEIVLGGSHLYEKLIQVLEQKPRTIGDFPAYPLLAKSLRDHKVPQMYRYVWIWSEDGTVMKQGCSWFTDFEACWAKGKSEGCPSYITFDGPGAPRATLCIEAVSPCNVHKAIFVDGEKDDGRLTEEMCCLQHA